MAVRKKKNTVLRQPKGLPLDGRARIVKAAIREFGRNGFGAASTNAIAEDAGVAKGLLFHHFGSKEALFAAAFEDVSTRAAAIILAPEPPLPPDLFERLAALSMRKLAFFQSDPDAYNVARAAVTSLPEPMRSTLLNQERAKLGERWEATMRGVDAGRLKNGMTPADAAETIMLLLEGLERSLVTAMEQARDGGASLMPELHQRVFKHLHRLRDGLYV